jgi:hypothetical protein
MGTDVDEECPAERQAHLAVVGRRIPDPSTRGLHRDEARGHPTRTSRLSQHYGPKVLEVERNGGRPCDVAIAFGQPSGFGRGDRSDDRVAGNTQAIDQLVDPVARRGRGHDEFQQHHLLRAILEAVGVGQPVGGPPLRLPCIGAEPPVPAPGAFARRPGRSALDPPDLERSDRRNSPPARWRAPFTGLQFGPSLVPASGTRAPPRTSRKPCRTRRAAELQRLFLRERRDSNPRPPA